MLSCIIVDDESDCREALSMLIKKFCPNLRLLATADGVKSAVRTIKQYKPDLVFLDIEMPDGSGFNLFSHFRRPFFSVIFTTAYDKYAIRAIKFAAVDYLLKPIDFRMLVVAVERVEKIHQTNTLLNNTKSIEVLIKNLQNTANARIAIPTALGLDFIAVKNIVRLQADSNYVIVHLQSGQKVAATKTMNDFEEILSKATFFRIHKSDIVNRTYIQKYLKKGSGSVMMYDGTAIAIARRRKDDFLRWIQR